MGEPRRSLTRQIQRTRLGAPLICDVSQQQVNMIPTRYKSKLPKQLCFPVGAQILSDALSGVPQLSSLSVAFHFTWPTTVNHIKYLVEERKPMEILSASYRNIRPGRSGSHDLEKMGWYDETWELSVYPTFRDKKAVTRELIVKEGLSEIIDWFNEPRNPTWCEGRHNCSLFVTYDGDECTISHEIDSNG